MDKNYYNVSLYKVNINSKNKDERLKCRNHNYVNINENKKDLSNNYKLINSTRGDLQERLKKCYTYKNNNNINNPKMQQYSTIIQSKNIYA